jgi:LSD1 subclass zinc finger protein
MPVQMICPSLKCRKFLTVPDAVRGKLVRCPHCQTMFRVPEPKRSEAASTGAGKSSK